MAKVVRLKSFEQRRWFSGVSVLVDAAGAEVRATTPREGEVMFQLGKFVREKRQSARAKVPGEASTVEARLEKIPGSQALEARFYVDGLLVESSREVMSRELLAKHGECQIRMTNGKFLAAIRDPSKVRSSPKDALRSSPRPENCPCKDWGAPHPGRHHPICEWNVKAPPEERGEGAVSAGDIEIIQKGVEKALPAPAPSAIAPRSAAVLPSPDDCVCKTFARTAEQEGLPGHHPICEWHDAWENRERVEEFLVDVASGEKSRAATSEEIKLADESEKASGSRIITVDDKSYAVVPS